MSDTDRITAETQYSISDWAEITFGSTYALRSVTRVNEEMAELLRLISTPSSSSDAIAEECADILITLYRVADVMHFDLLSEVDRKMKINRNRKWKLDGSGCGQHVD